MTLVPNNDFSKSLEELDKIQSTCAKLLQTKHYQKLGEEGIHAILARAKALGIHPFEALNGGFQCIQGKVGMSTEMMAALVRSRGHSITKDPKSTPDCCILHGKRADNGDTWTISFSLKDAELAGLLSSPTWKKYPQVMLYNRAMSQLFRQLFPDLSLGAGYVEDELKEITKTGEYAAVKPLDIQMVEAEVVKEERKLVSQEQADELKELLKKCPHEYVEKVTSGLLRMKPAIEKLEDLPLDLFEKAKAAAIKNAKAKSLEAEENKEVVNG